MHNLCLPFEEALAKRKREGVLRTLRPIQKGVDFYSNDYLGFADEQGDGTLNINVAIQGGGSEVYLGTATLNADGTYDLHLKNNTTGELATGTLEKSS